MKTLILSILIFLTIFKVYATTPSDSIDVLSYDIFIKIQSSKQNFIYVEEKIVFKTPKKQQISFDAGNFIINDLKLNSKKIKYTQQKNSITLRGNLHLKDSNLLEIKYFAYPFEDELWGGFFIKNKNFFNIGIGMASNPVSLGRSWLICNDKFDDKAFFNYKISTPFGFWASAGGKLIKIDTLENEIIFTWQQNKPVPPYLASFSLGAYDTISFYVKSINDKQIPVLLTLFNKKDSSSFENLKKAFEIFENKWGEYPFDKIGFTEVMFESGGMEHSENIAISNYAINGTLKNESLLYHELSHSWFGNYVTAKKPRDIWLHEGWAKYNESIFFEYTYGPQYAKKHNRIRHFYALNFSHLNDSGFLALSNIPLKKTYGTTMYYKGGDVVQNLRFFMGDSLFFSTTKAFLKHYAYKNVTLEDFTNFFIEKSHLKWLKEFFDYWLYDSGYPFYEIEKFSIVKHEDKYIAFVNISQRTKGSKTIPAVNKIDFSFIDDNLNIHTLPVLINKDFSQYSFQLNFDPKTVFLNLEENLADATTSNYQIICDTGTYIFDESLFDLKVERIQKKAFFRIKCNFIEPTNTHKQNIILQKTYYWTIEGLWNDDFHAKGKFYLTTLMDENFTNTSKIYHIKLLYRPTPNDEWEEIEYKHKYDYLEAPIKKGDYALAFIK